jgi:acyl carrier protein
MDTLMPSSELPYPDLATIFEDVFEHVEPLTRETSAVHVTRWDSLQHVALVHAIETTFDINLSMDEMMEMRTVGDIEAVLRRHGV